MMIESIIHNKGPCKPRPQSVLCVCFLNLPENMIDLNSFPELRRSRKIDRVIPFPHPMCPVDEYRNFHTRKEVVCIVPIMTQCFNLIFKLLEKGLVLLLH